MAECMQDTENNVEDNKTDDNSIDFASLPSESEFSAVIFNNVPECYPPEKDIECCYTMKRSVKPNSRDWIGLFKVGWQSSREHYTYEWSPLPVVQNGEQGKAIHNRVLFRERYLPKADEEFYQFCYVTYAGDIRGASVPFQIKTKPVEHDLECCEIEDEDGSSIMLVKNKTAMLEESLARTLEENAVLRASKETVEADLSNANEKIMTLESRKVELTTAVKTREKRLAQLESVLAQKEQCLDAEQSRRKDLESMVTDLKCLQENSDRKIDELMMLAEQQRAQTSEVEKNKEKLVVERKQYLDTMTADRQMIEKQQNDIKAKEEELNLLKARFIEFKNKARAESDDHSQKLEKLTTANGKLQEQLAQSIAENNILKRNMEEESEQLNKKVRDTHVELKSKDQEVQRLQQEISDYNHIIKDLESSKDEILKDASHEAELYGKKIEKLLDEGKEKQELIFQLEQDLEDVKSQLNQEKGKTTALEEDYESVIRALQDQLDAEKTLNQSLCSQSDRNLASLQAQVQKQLETNMEMAAKLDARKAEIRALCDELDDCKKQISKSEGETQSILARFTAADAEVKSLKVEKENLQTALTDTRGASAQTSKNSKASMYALQTAHSHLEKSYLKVKKERDELWEKRNELKNSITALQGGLSSDDLRLQIEELRANNEDLRVRLNMGADAYKGMFIRCRQQQAKLDKLKRTSSVESLESGTVLEMQSVVAKLQKALDNEKRAVNVEKNMVVQKNDEINQLQLEICELREKVKHQEHQQLQKMDSGPSQQMVEELLEKISSLERDMAVEKAEKESIIRELVNVQEVLKMKEEEITMCEENLKATQDALSTEQADREALGEEARQKLQEHEENEHKLDLKVKELTREVERWKKEVDLHVEAESKLMENRTEEEVTPVEKQEPKKEQGTPSGQGFMPVRGILPFWNRPRLAPPQGTQYHPWVLVQQPQNATDPSPVAPSPVAPSPIAPSQPQPVAIQPMQPSAPEPEVPQCPVCEAFLPPSVDRDKHVNGHFD